MAYTFDPATRSIVMPKGDTLDINITIDSEDSRVYEAIVFAIFTRAGEDILRVPVTVENGSASIRLANHHTRDLDAGRYRWNLRLVTDPAHDSEGNIIADEPSDDVLTVFGPDISDIPEFWLVENGGRV